MQVPDFKSQSGYHSESESVSSKGKTTYSKLPVAIALDRSEASSLDDALRALAIFQRVHQASTHDKWICSHWMKLIQSCSVSCFVSLDADATEYGNPLSVVRNTQVCSLQRTCLVWCGVCAFALCTCPFCSYRPLNSPSATVLRNSFSLHRGFQQETIFARCVLQVNQARWT